MSCCFFVAFVAAWLFTVGVKGSGVWTTAVEKVAVKVMIEMQDEVMLLTSSVFRFSPMGIEYFWFLVVNGWIFWELVIFLHKCVISVIL